MPWMPDRMSPSGFRWVDEQPSAPGPRQQLMGQAGAAGGFADQAQQNYGNMTAESQATRDYLAGLMRGENSLSAEQLRQGLQQNLAAQRSQAAGAAPQNAAMAARTAAMNMGRLGAGMSGQAAMAGIAERNAAAGQLGQMQLGARGQDVNAAIGSRGNAIQGYGNAIEPKGPSMWDKLLGAGVGLGGAALMSDERLKTDIKDGGKDATRLLDGLKAYTYRYKDEKYGKGKQVGVMAQDLEKVAPQAVVDTREGKAVDSAKLAGALAAALPTMHDRIKKLEGKR